MVSKLEEKFAVKFRINKSSNFLRKRKRPRLLLAAERRRYKNLVRATTKLCKR